MSDSQPSRLPVHGRGASLNPTNRFERIAVEIECDDSPSQRIATQVFQDDSQSIISQNDSPDVPFRYSINPYRGCEHGCSYCYARPTHEYLGWSAGVDFESRILAKTNAVPLLKKWLRKPGWNGERLALSGVTDPYQPVERKLQITRQILQLLWECRNPVSLITKNALIERDVDLLGEMAKWKLSSVAVSITTLDSDLARELEPRCSSPDARLRTIQTLTEAGVPVFVSVAPIIPGLNDHEIPSILEAAAGVGAVGAGMILLRLPGAVEPIFTDWLERHRPLAKERVLSRIRSTREGELSDSRFGKRMRGVGPMADQILQSFRVFRDKLGLMATRAELDASHFRPPPDDHGQLMLW